MLFFHFFLLSLAALLSSFELAENNPPNPFLGDQLSVGVINNAASSDLGSNPAHAQHDTNESPYQHVVRSPALGFIDPGKCTVNDGCDNTFSTIDAVNSKIRNSVQALVKTDFFKFFKLQLYKECPFWQENPMCFSPSCAVEIDEDDDDLKKNYSNYNKNKRNDTLELTDSKNKKLMEYNCDYCNTSEEYQDNAVYLDLTLNPERFSGYGGEEAGRIWRAIYLENCFNKSPSELEVQDKTPALKFNNKYFNILASWSNKLQKNLNLGNYSKLVSLMNQAEDTCLEKRVFYRLISGMHASIGTHLSFEWLNTNKRNAEFEPNLNLWMERVGYFSDRLLNIYFNYSLVIKAILKLSDYLNEIQFSESNVEKQLINNIVTTLKPHEKNIFNENLLFNYEDDLSNQLLKNEFRTNFKNVSTLMDCVGCERCRLWGKVQTLGYGTGLKVLFELNDKNTEFDVKSLKRSEIVALINTFDRLSKSIEIVQYFRNEYNKQANLKDNEQPVTIQRDGLADGNIDGSDVFGADAYAENAKRVSYQQKIFKKGSFASDSDSFNKINEQKVNDQTKLVQSEPESQDEEEEEKEENFAYEDNIELPTSIRAQNVDDSKKKLKKLFKQKKKEYQSRDPKAKSGSYYEEEDDDDEEEYEGLSKDEIRFKKIFKRSIKLKASKPFSEKTFTDHLLEVVEEFKDVFRFMWHSYVNFPYNLYRLTLNKLEIYWNYFIGNDEFFLQKKKEFYRLKNLEDN